MCSKLTIQNLHHNDKLAENTIFVLCFSYFLLIVQSLVDGRFINRLGNTKKAPSLWRPVHVRLEPRRGELQLFELCTATEDG